MVINLGRYKNHDNARRVEFPLLTSVHHKRNLLQVTSVTFLTFVTIVVIVVIISWSPYIHDIFKGKSDWRYGEHCSKEGKHCWHTGRHHNDEIVTISYIFTIVLTHLLFSVLWGRRLGIVKGAILLDINNFCIWEYCKPIYATVCCQVRAILCGSYVFGFYLQVI